MQKFYTIKETAQKAGQSVATLQREIKENRFPAGLRISKGSRRWTEDMIEKWQSNLTA